MPQVQDELETTGPVTQAAGESSTAPDRTKRILLWVILIGILLRLLRYLADRSLWLDEAYLADSILTYSFKQLLTQPLLYWQAAPVGFVLMQKLAVGAFGTSEYALRLVPIMAGVASVPLFYAIIRRCLEPMAQVLAMTFFITVDPLIYYASEAKQYGMDVLIALAIVWAAMRFRERPLSWGRLIALTVIGMLGIFCSHPAIFVLASSGLVLLFAPLTTRAHDPRRAVPSPAREMRPPDETETNTESLQSKQWQISLRLLVTGALWLGLFAVNYLLFLRPLMHHPGLAAYWAADYMPYDPLGALKWVGIELYGLYFGYATMWLPLVETAMLATLIGIGWFWRHNKAVLALLMLPLLLTLAAAVIHAYPFGSRLVLFLVPLLAVMIGAGAAVLWESIRPNRRWVAVLILALIYLPSAARDVYFIIFPQKREEIRPVLAYIRDHKQLGDKLYIFYISEVPFRYYENRFGLEKDRFGLADMQWILGQAGEPDKAFYRNDLARLRGKGRVWILITHPAALGGIDEEQLFPQILSPWGKQLDQVKKFNATAMLYDMRPSE